MAGGTEALDDASKRVLVANEVGVVLVIGLTPVLVAWMVAPGALLVGVVVGAGLAAAEVAIDLLWWRPRLRARAAPRAHVRWDPRPPTDPAVAVLDQPLALLAAHGFVEASRAATAVGPMAVAWARPDLAALVALFLEPDLSAPRWPTVALWTELRTALSCPVWLVTAEQSDRGVNIGTGFGRLVPGADVAALVEVHLEGLAWLAEQGLPAEPLAPADLGPRAAARVAALATAPVVPLWALPSASLGAWDVRRPLRSQRMARLMARRLRAQARRG